MSSLKENLQVQTSGVVLGVQEMALNAKNRFMQLRPVWRWLLLIVFFALIPGSIITRYSTEAVWTNLYSRNSLTAQPSFANPSKLQVGKVSIVANANNTYSAYAIVQNPNLDLGLDELPYTFTFYDSSGKQISETTGKTYLLPNQKSWLVVPRISSTAVISSGKISVGELKWQKRLSLPTVDLKMTEPYLYSQDLPPATVAEGAVVNNSPYTISSVELLVVFYDASGNVLAITPRQERSLEAYERRAYKLSWVGLDRSRVAKVGLEAYTNTMDPNNLRFEKDASVNSLIDINK